MKNRKIFKTLTINEFIKIIVNTLPFYSTHFQLFKNPYNQPYISRNFYNEKIHKNILKSLPFYSNCKMKKCKILKILEIDEIHKKHSKYLVYLLKMNY